ncbi:hypothetical protein BCGKFG_BCGKFG_11080, partial [Dysosmobacter welbionis]
GHTLRRSSAVPPGGSRSRTLPPGTRSLPAGPTGRRRPGWRCRNPQKSATP